jgi:hypothetical protein
MGLPIINVFYPLDVHRDHEDIKVVVDIPAK